jgi:hypothetical protein
LPLRRSHWFNMRVSSASINAPVDEKGEKRGRECPPF